MLFSCFKKSCRVSGARFERRDIPITEINFKIAKNGRKIAQAKCQVCGTIMSKIISEKEYKSLNIS